MLIRPIYYVIILVYTLVFGITVYALFFQDTESDGVNGIVSRFLFERIPKMFLKGLRMTVVGT